MNPKLEEIVRRCPSEQVKTLVLEAFILGQEDGRPQRVRNSGEPSMPQLKARLEELEKPGDMTGS